VATPRAARPIFVAGHRGLVGSAIVRRLRSRGETNLALATRDELDLRNQASVNAWFERVQPSEVYLVAGTVGGIMANSTRPAEFLYDNIMIHSTVIEASYRTGVDKLLYLGSSCIYPRLASQPIHESALLTGELEPTNEAYALAKISGMRMCEAYRHQYGCNFISAMPTNLYGPGDNFDLEASHVIPALIRKFHEAKQTGQATVEIWGSGKPRREFLHVDDLASACVHLMKRYDGAEHVNVGTGVDVSIRELAETISAVVYPDAELKFDSTRPDGMPRKVLDIGRLYDTGWESSIALDEGIGSTYAWFAENFEYGSLRGI